MSDELDDADLDTDDLAQEGVRAFNRMTAAMHGLEGRIITVDASLGTKVSAAERAATLAASAAMSRAAVVQPSNAALAAIPGASAARISWSVGSGGSVMRAPYASSPRASRPRTSTSAAATNAAPTRSAAPSRSP